MIYVSMEKRTWKKIHKFLDTTEKDCIDLEQRRELTEFGEGQLNIIRIIKNMIREN